MSVNGDPSKLIKEEESKGLLLSTATIETEAPKVKPLEGFREVA